MPFSDGRKDLLTEGANFGLFGYGWFFLWVCTVSDPVACNNDIWLLPVAAVYHSFVPVSFPSGGNRGQLLLVVDIKRSNNRSLIEAIISA